MAFSDLTLSDVQDLLARYGNDFVTEQTNLMAPFFSSGSLKKRKNRGKVIIVLVKAGGLASTGFLADGGNLPDKKGKTPARGTLFPKVLFSRLGIGRLAVATLVDVNDAISLFKENTESMAEDIARQRGRAVAKTSLGSPATVPSTTTITVSDPSGWRVGSKVDRYNTSDVYQETVEITDVDIPASGNSTITFAAAATRATTDTFYLQGAHDNAPTSLSDVTADASLYGLSQNANDWAANRNPSIGTLSIDDMRLASVLHRRRRGKAHDCAVMNSVNEKRYSDLNLAQRRFMPGQKLDVRGGLKSEFEGKPIEVDENFPDDEIYLITESDLYWNETVSLHSDRDGSPAQMLGSSAPHAHVDQNEFAIDVHMWEAGNLVCTRRSGISILAGITG